MALDNFFHAQRGADDRPYPRYAELHARREARRPARWIHGQDLRDLQVWHKLAWIDPFYLDADARVRRPGAEGARLHRGRQGRVLRAGRARDPAAGSSPSIATRAERGQVELSTSPFYHPILPLLCDTDVYLGAHPTASPPRTPFRHPEDARGAARRARSVSTPAVRTRPARRCGRPKGRSRTRWCRSWRRAGLRWMATDEDDPGRGRSADALCRDDGDGLPRRPGAAVPALQRAGRRRATIACLFRDHALSDLIGFVYAGVGAGSTRPHDFIWRLVEAAGGFAATTGGEDATISVILDGENAWEHFEGAGGRSCAPCTAVLSTHDGAPTGHDGRGVRSPPETLTHDLPRVVDRRQLLHLDRARRRSPRRGGSCAMHGRRSDASRRRVTAAARDQAYEELLIAEGSDWFWWYGDDHSSDHDAEFDDLFRRHVRNVYRALGPRAARRAVRHQHQHRASGGCGRRDDQGRRLTTSALGPRQPSTR